ncbi:hypothetical protein BMJ31_25175 [Sinorhizobium medicae]|nr:hypothetical protein BMJ31_25175 [Sinorhizobium medicae]
MSLRPSKTSVSTYLLRAREAGLAVWPLPPGLDDDAVLEQRLFRRTHQYRVQRDNQDETRIASPKLFPNIQPLPHIICSLPRGMNRGDYGTAEHGDEERTDGGGFGALSCFDASGEGENSG